MPLPNTIALGGVPTGRTKAKEQAKVTGSIKVKGWFPVCWARVATIGTKMLAVTVFEQIFVTAMAMDMVRS